MLHLQSACGCLFHEFDRIWNFEQCKVNGQKFTFLSFKDRYITHMYTLFLLKISLITVAQFLKILVEDRYVYLSGKL